MINPLYHIFLWLDKKITRRKNYVNKREKFIIIFLGVSKADNGCTKQYEKVLIELTNLAYKLGIKDGTPQNREFMALENEIVELFQMTKDVYFSFGENAKEVIEDYDLNWTPNTIEESKKVA